jgi:RNA polymerase sigma factor (TIGR02999 family)
MSPFLPRPRKRNARKPPSALAAREIRPAPAGSRDNVAAMGDEDVTGMLEALSAGDRSVVDHLLPIVYAELKRRASSLMRRERSDHTLQPTVLVHDAFMQLVRQDRVDWQGRAHFFAMASQMMRRVLVDHARARLRDKRGGGAARVSLDEGLGLSAERDLDVVALDEVLARLAELDRRQAEIVEMRFFGGLSVEEVAAVMSLSKRTIEGEWTMIKAWLRRELVA